MVAVRFMRGDVAGEESIMGGVTNATALTWRDVRAWANNKPHPWGDDTRSVCLFSCGHTGVTPSSTRTNNGKHANSTHSKWQSVHNKNMWIHSSLREETVSWCHEGYNCQNRQYVLNWVLSLKLQCHENQIRHFFRSNKNVFVGDAHGQITLIQNNVDSGLQWKCEIV